MEVSGRVLKVLSPETGEGKNGAWIKQTLVLETIEQYPKKIAIDFMGEALTTQISRLQIADEVTVSININSREYNDKWYTNVGGWKIVIDDSQGAPQAAAPQAQSTQSAPAATKPKAAAQVAEIPDTDDGEELPF